MTVVAFCLSRFTPTDIAEFDSIAQNKLKRGLWSSVVRQSGPGYDLINIRFPGVEKPVFSFERDKQGTYNLWYHDRGGSHSIGYGETAAECLAVWRPRARTGATDRAARMGDVSATA